MVKYQHEPEELGRKEVEKLIKDYLEGDDDSLYPGLQAAVRKLAEKIANDLCWKAYHAGYKQAWGEVGLEAMERGRDY